MPAKKFDHGALSSRVQEERRLLIRQTTMMTLTMTRCCCCCWWWSITTSSRWCRRQHPTARMSVTWFVIIIDPAGECANENSAFPEFSCIEICRRRRLRPSPLYWASAVATATPASSDVRAILSPMLITRPASRRSPQKRCLYRRLRQ